MDLEALCK
jgi:hypothetical protein